MFDSLWASWADRAEPVRGGDSGQLGAGREHQETEAAEGARAERRDQGDAAAPAAPLREVSRPASDDAPAQGPLRLQPAQGALCLPRVFGSPRPFPHIDSELGSN